jgi:branched-chain amino acid transport system permease protein
MRQNVKSGLTFGLVGGLVTFIFGGWSVAVIGVLMGLALGLTLANRFDRPSERYDWNGFSNSLESLRKILKGAGKISWASLPAALTATILLISLSVFQNIVILPALGKSATTTALYINSNVVGALGALVMTLLTASLHTLPEKWERVGRLILLAAIIIAFPFVDRATGLRWSAQVIFALIFVILGLGLNIVVGYAGLLDLGYAAFFAIGAYTTGILSSPVHDIQWNFWIVIWIAAGMAAIWGLILGAPTLPLRGDYLAIVTLGFGEIVPVIFRNLIDVTIKEPFTCWILPGLIRLFGGETGMACLTLVSHEDLTLGEKGISPIGRPSLPIIGVFQSDNPVTWYFLIIAIILLSVFLINRLRESRLGRAWMAIREDELAAAQMGIDPVRTKLLAFAMGATFSGFAGAFYAAYVRGIFPSAFDFSVSIIVLCIVILGGLGNVNGVIVGGLVIMTADRLFLPALKDFLKALLDHTILPALASNPTLQAAVAQNANPILYRYLLFGLTLVIMMAVRPEGLIPSAQRRMELHADEEQAGGEAVADEIAEEAAQAGKKSSGKKPKSTSAGGGPGE